MTRWHDKVYTLLTRWQSFLAWIDIAKMSDRLSTTRAKKINFSCSSLLACPFSRASNLFCLCERYAIEILLFNCNPTFFRLSCLLVFATPNTLLFLLLIIFILFLVCDEHGVPCSDGSNSCLMYAWYAHNVHMCAVKSYQYKPLAMLANAVTDFNIISWMSCSKESHICNLGYGFMCIADEKQLRM